MRKENMNKSTKPVLTMEEALAQHPPFLVDLT